MQRVEPPQLERHTLILNVNIMRLWVLHGLLRTKRRVCMSNKRESGGIKGAHW